MVRNGAQWLGIDQNVWMRFVLLGLDTHMSIALSALDSCASDNQSLCTWHPGNRITSGTLVLKSDRILWSESDTIRESNKIYSRYCNLVPIRRILIKWIVIMIWPLDPSVISSHGFLSDFVDWLDLIRSYRIRYRIDWAGFFFSFCKCTWIVLLSIHVPLCIYLFLTDEVNMRLTKRFENKNMIYSAIISLSFIIKYIYRVWHIYHCHLSWLII